jgi:carboxymethylenebutenolidase
MSRPDSQRVSVPTDAGEMPAHLWVPESGTGPGLLLLQEIFGVSRYIRQRGADLAEAGYVVLAPELYWRLDVAEQDAAALDVSGPDVIEQAVALMQQLDWDTTVQDAVSGLHALRGRAEVQGGAGIIGFCFGGGLGFAVAATDHSDVLVSYYGSALGGLLDLTSSVTAPSLHHFGLADSYVDVATVQRIRDAVTAGPGPVEFETYPGADHAFDNPDFMFHHPEASALAWQRTLAFLSATLQGSAGAQT